jgi:hypothetical protein
MNLDRSVTLPRPMANDRRADRAPTRWLQRVAAWMKRRSCDGFASCACTSSWWSAL